MSKNKWLNAFRYSEKQGNCPHFEINGAHQFLADGCIGVLHYDECKVALNCGALIVEIHGEGLGLLRLGDEEAEVTGKIRSIECL